MSRAANEGELQELHDSLAKTLAEAVVETEIKVIDIPDGENEDGTTRYKKVAVKTRNAAVLNAARQFLKDNGIQCARGRPSTAVSELKDKFDLPFEGQGALPN